MASARILIGTIDLAGTDLMHRKTGESAFRFTEYKRTSDQGQVFQYQGDSSGYYIEVEGEIVADNHDNEIMGRRSAGPTYVGQKEVFSYFVYGYRMDWSKVQKA